MRWTHIYDFLVQVLCGLFALVFVFIAFLFTEQPVVLFVTFLVAAFILYRYVFRTVGSWLYARLTLGMDISFSQAKALDGAFAPTLFSQLKWLPMKELKQLDKSQRYEVALRMLQQWSEDHALTRQQAKEDFKNAAPKTKALTILMFIVCAYMLVAGFLNLPPCSFIAYIICKVFSTDMYFPVLNGAIMILITILLFKLVDKNIK